jgi:hypothetical protein
MADLKKERNRNNFASKLLKISDLEAIFQQQSIPPR